MIMVLYKRKPVQYLPRPTIEDDSSEVWVIPATNEVFTNYEPYLQRMDFYKQRRFICEITGRSGMTFFEALRYEAEESRELNNAFPDALREPILRRVQFSTVSRVDHLVDEIYEEFKQDFYPGESVVILLKDNTRLQGMIRDKMKFPSQMYPDGSVKSEAYARYLVKILDRPNEEALLDQNHITRDRKIFSKLMLRAFIKNSVTREAWNGAPWLVKPALTEEYKIETEVPKHLQHGARAAEKKAMKKNSQEGSFGMFAAQRLPELKPAVSSSKSKPSLPDMSKAKQQRFHQEFLEYQRSLNGDSSFTTIKSRGLSSARQSKSKDEKKVVSVPVVVIKPEPFPPPPPPPIKYPIEDLDIPPAEDKHPRPEIKFVLDEPHSWFDDEEMLQDEIRRESVGPLLETWDTLNVYCEVFQLDSFTFDAFLEALRFSSDEIECQLLVEIHCALLKTIVNAEGDNEGAIQVSLPDMPQNEESESEEDQEEESSPEPEPVFTRMTTRSSLAKAEAENLKAHLNGTIAEPDAKLHRAAEVLNGYGWVDRLRKRDFKNGGWEVIMVGLLYQLSLRPSKTKACEEILQCLAPVDEDPTQENVCGRYGTLDVNLRIQALEAICRLTLETRAIKQYMEECSNQMTELRKDRIDLQRKRKELLQDLRKLHEEKKELQPGLEKTNSLVPDSNTPQEIKPSAVDDESDQCIDTDDDDQRGPSLRGGADRILERRRRQEAERERKEQLAKQPKGSKQYQRVLKKIDDVRAKITSLEDDIAVVENDMREADCSRTRCLGKDRFCNRYWWFERNAMPYEGLPSSSTAEAKYANGRLWVQGPSDLEREGFIDVPEDYKKQYVKQFQMTPTERRKKEEGPTNLLNAHHWGYYDDESSVDQLIAWLDPRGVREIKLKKELELFREPIVRYMKNRREYLALSAKQSESEDAPSKRMSTRTKSYVDDDKHRCLQWKNSIALTENGHLHLDSGRPSKRTKRATDDSTDIKTTHKRVKPLTRQSSRHQF